METVVYCNPGYTLVDTGISGKPISEMMIVGVGLISLESLRFQVFRQGLRV